MDHAETYTIHTDGGARGNPGPAAIGVVIDHEGKTVHEFGRYIGATTNNVAEYTAVIDALEWLKSNNKHPALVQFILDSELVVKQLGGIYKIKDAKLRELSFKVRMLEADIKASVRYMAVRREENKRADYFVNKALDEALA